MVISTPTNTGMYTGYAPNASFGSLYQRALGSNFGNNKVYASSLGDIEAVMSAYGNPVWSSIYTAGASMSSTILSSSNSIDFSDPKWDVQASLNLTQVYQKGEWDCTVGCKQSVDLFYKSTDQSSINNSWLARVNTLNSDGKGGLKNSLIQGYYQGAGYSTNSFGNGYFGKYKSNSALRWIVGEMAKQRIVQIGWHPTGTDGHASLIKSVMYRNNFSEFKIELMNPGAGARVINPNSFNLIYQIFSIWK